MKLKGLLVVSLAFLLGGFCMLILTADLDNLDSPRLTVRPAFADDDKYFTDWLHDFALSDSCSAETALALAHMKAQMIEDEVDLVLPAAAAVWLWKWIWGD
jgi:hypothetical protein